MSAFDFMSSTGSMGAPTSVEFDHIAKALEAMEGITDSASLQSLGALQPQSLENIINNLQVRDSHYVLWNTLRPMMEKARSTVEEYAQRISYGQATGMVGQLENPSEADPDFRRQHSYIKFLRQIWKAGDVAQQVETLSPAVTEAKEAALKRLLNTFTFNAYKGDSTMVTESVDGFEKTIVDLGSTDHILDLRGSLPTQQQFSDLTGVILDNYGSTSDLKLFSSTGGLNQLGRIITESATTNRQRWNYGFGPDGSAQLGTSVTKINTQFGAITPIPDLFLSSAYENDVPVTSVAARAPLAPLSVVPSAVADAAPATSKWTDTDLRPSGGGTGYKYKVAAGNRFGVSTAIETSAATTIAAGQRMSLVITPTAGDPNPATYYIVYGESTEGAADYVAIGRVAANSTSAVTFYDYNFIIPGTTTAFLLDLSISGEGPSGPFYQW